MEHGHGDCYVSPLVPEGMDMIVQRYMHQAMSQYALPIQTAAPAPRRSTECGGGIAHWAQLCSAQRVGEFDPRTWKRRFPIRDALLINLLPEHFNGLCQNAKFWRLGLVLQDSTHRVFEGYWLHLNSPWLHLNSPTQDCTPARKRPPA